MLAVSSEMQGGDAIASQTSSNEHCPVWPQIRESIKALFPDRDCFALKRPMSDEDQLSRLETIPPSQLRPEFREVLSGFMQQLGIVTPRIMLLLSLYCRIGAGACAAHAADLCASSAKAAGDPDHLRAHAGRPGQCIC